MARVALGFRAHSGWAAVVAVAGSPRSPIVVERQRLVLADPEIRGSDQPYHAAQGLELEKAKAVLRRYRDSSRQLARHSMRSLLRGLQRNGDEIVGCGLLLSSGRLPNSIPAILASHALIHTADGEFFRDAIVHACERSGLPVVKVRERELYENAAKVLRMTATRPRRHIADIGREIGPPWREDQKLAFLVAWMALVS